MRSHHLLAAAALSLGTVLSAQTSYFNATLSSDQEVPPNASTARGWGIVKLVEPANTVSAFLHTTTLSAAYTASHIHMAPVGVNGGVILPLAPSGTNTYSGSGVFTAAQVAALKAAGCYLNIHTTANPGGELRGQIVTPTMTAYVANLSGLQEVPPTPSAGTGTAIAFLDEPNSALMYTVTGGGLTGPVTAAHIHQAAAGVNGGVIHPLNGSGTTYCGVYILTPAQLTAAKANGLYFNMHTAAFPGGEIRGQMNLSDPSEFSGPMNGAQETPPNASNAVGHACVRINANGTASLLFTNSPLATPATAAHIHRAAAGVAGGVIFPMAGGPTVWTATTPVLTAAQIADVRAGLWYANIHSTAFPGGEIRGQLAATNRATSYGPPGAGGTAAAPRRAYMGTTNNACIGDSFAITQFGATPGIPALLALGLTRDPIFGLPAPIDLGGIGAPGNFLLTDLGVFPLIGTATDPLGCASVSLTVPFSPPLRGGVLYAQYLNLDFGANPASLSTSNAITLTIQ